jgi:UDP-glucose 6-dehydrogenase
MAIETKIDISKQVQAIVEKALEMELEKEFTEAVKRFNERKTEILARVLVSIYSQVEMQSNGHNIVFTLREIKK